ncbi:unnamed protein product [Tilletia controversa]|uniref:Uncharacterized protein n=1 Tax=Tilletia controversa TaxID=13291 RepID=A0A8X7MQC2_9BASI|nr:hypothetical protein CF328_g3666 [Tilletia controversa]KAE8244082.1 hypothetical protein A4X06_0g5981 [Tilletia controversa]CAD6932397.1 unnamed protein product [Tilletia controversa]CAD6935535.1 unnamed protein product [Tilletia controversa]CAD6941305.1 unnamed protein product [Tilletia controversa]
MQQDSQPPARVSTESSSHPSHLAAATRAAAASSAPPATTSTPDDFPARFHAVNQERQRERRARYMRGPVRVVRDAVWKGSYTIGTHTALVMLEPWEVILILILTSLVVVAVTFYIAYRLPTHSQVAAERATYYLFGTRSSSSLVNSS